MKKNTTKACVVFLAAVLLCSCGGGAQNNGDALNSGGAVQNGGSAGSTAAVQEVLSTAEESESTDDGDSVDVPAVPENAELMYEKSTLRVYLLQDASRNVPAFFVDLPQGYELYVEDVVLNGRIYAENCGNMLDAGFERRQEEMDAFDTSQVMQRIVFLEDTFQNMTFRFYVCRPEWAGAEAPEDEALTDSHLRSPGFLVVRNTDGTYAFEETGTSGLAPEELFTRMGIDMASVTQESNGYMLSSMVAEAQLTDYMYDVRVYGTEDVNRVTWYRGSSNFAGGSSEEQAERIFREELETFLNAFATDEADRAAIGAWWEEYLEYASRGNPPAGGPSVIINGWRFGDGSGIGGNIVYVGAWEHLSVPAAEELAGALPAFGDKTYTISCSDSMMDDLFATNRGMLDITEIAPDGDNESGMAITYRLTTNGKEYHYLSTSFQTGADYSNRAEGFEKELAAAEAAGAVIDFRNESESQVNGNPYTRLQAVYHYE